MQKMGFGGAILAMWQGYNVGRESWKEPGMTSFPALGIWHIGRAANPTIIKFTLGSDSFKEWVPTNADLLAADWIKYD